MSRIDELIAKLCPEGVEFRAIGDFGELVRGNGMPKSDFVEMGVGCIHYGQIYTFYGIWATKTKSFIPAEKAARLAKVNPGDLIITNTSENIDDVCKGVAWLGEGQIVTGGHATVLKHDQNAKYLSYYLQTPHFFAEKKRHATGTKVIDVSAKNLAKIKIPLPPLEIQQEIVAILDKFTKLEAELEARRAQYNHYRNALLTFDECVDSGRKEVTRVVTLGEIATFRRGTAITQKQTVAGTFPVIANGPNPVYSHNECNREGETIVIARSGANAGFVSYWERPLFLTDAFSVHPDQSVMHVKFAYYLLKHKETAIRGIKKGSGVPHIQVKAMDAIEIPIPPLEEQERIVAILDKFDALVNDLSSGLPAEIKARRLQYEHYRDRLLTFREAK